MKMIGKTSTCFGAITFALFFGTQASVADSDQTVCAKLGDEDGMSYVIPHGGVKGAHYIKPLHSGQQTLPWKSNGWIYFVASENDDQLETVDHFRVVTIDSSKGKGANVEVGLDRSAVNTECYDGWSKFWHGYGSESHKQTTVDYYDKRRHEENKYIDNNLNRWHFDWLNIQNGQKTCPNTSAHVPAIQDADASSNESPSIKNLSSSEAVAATKNVKMPVPANVSAMSMVLVHRKQNGASCLGIALGATSIPEQTKINRLRFRKVGQRFLGPSTVINWIE